MKRIIFILETLAFGLLFLAAQNLYSGDTGAPRYQTWWAYVLYGIGFLLLIFLAVKRRAKKLAQQKLRLEQIINERTKEIKEENLQLKKQSQQLLEMDQVKSRFFANISHDFRTPLTLIMGPLEQMLSESQDQNQKEKLKVMLQNSQRLLTLINQLLDLSRFDSGKMKLQAARQNIVPFLEGILASFHILALQNQLNLEFHSDEEEISLYFDTQKMEEVMFNLLINAVKFTPADGTIAVSVSKKEEKTPGFVNISVRDTGTGIPQEQLVHIFDRFYQAGTPWEKGNQGTGIGLTLTKEIVLLHHGKIDAHSQEGKGTEFVIRLPLGEKHLKSDEIAVPSEAPLYPEKSKELERLYMVPEEEAEPGAVDIDTGKKSENIILIVDDNAIFRKYIRGRLEPLYTIRDAVDGLDGINKAREIIPDLIISDIMMPGVDGYKLCDVLKKDVITSHIPVILLTAKAGDEDIIEGLETGADDYITKPFKTNILIARIKNLIDQRRQLQLKLQSQKTMPSAEIPVSPIDEAFFKEFQEIIEKNLSNPDFNEERLCLEFHMSQDTLSRKIQGLTGEPLTQYLLSYRLERAAQLLKANFGNVTEVAFKIGFPSTADFAKCFKEKFHQLPTSFQTSFETSAKITKNK